MIKPSFLFTDNAVLQWGKEVPVWGECDSDSVTVSYCGASVDVKVENGYFEAILPAMPAKLSGELVFKSDDETLSLNNVVTGDVYIAGGQSNMEHPLFCSFYDDEDLTADDGIRLFTVPRRPYENADIWGFHFYALRADDTPWETYTEKRAMGFCAIACYFAKRLRKDVDIPIGIIECNWGATAAESWIDRDRLLEKSMARWCVDNYDEKFKDIDMDAYHQEFVAWHSELLEYNKEHDAMEEAKQFGIPYVLRNFFKKTYKLGPYHYTTPCLHRRTMLARVTPFAICGVLWYQGETNSAYPGNPLPIRPWFKEVMETLHEDWRDAFRAPDLPFYTVQLSTHSHGNRDGGKEFFDIREVQKELTLQKNIFTVVSADIGERDNVHPANKKPVGERLALTVLANYYKKDVAWQSPDVSDVSIKDGEIIISFDNAKELSAKGDKADGFFLTKKNDETLPAVVTLSGNTARIPYSEDIIAVGFCNRNYAYINVYNESGLPPFPFERSI